MVSIKNGGALFYLEKVDENFCFYQTSAAGGKRPARERGYQVCTEPTTRTGSSFKLVLPTCNRFSRTFSLAKRFSSSPNERLTIRCFAFCGRRPEFHSGLDNFLKKIDENFCFYQTSAAGGKRPARERGYQVCTEPTTRVALVLSQKVQANRVQLQAGAV